LSNGFFEEEEEPREVEAATLVLNVDRRRRLF